MSKIKHTWLREESRIIIRKENRTENTGNNHSAKINFGITNVQLNYLPTSTLMSPFKFSKIGKTKT